MKETSYIIIANVYDMYSGPSLPYKHCKQVLRARHPRGAPEGPRAPGPQSPGASGSQSPGALGPRSPKKPDYPRGPKGHPPPLLTQFYDLTLSICQDGWVLMAVDLSSSRLMFARVETSLLSFLFGLLRFLLILFCISWLFLLARMAEWLRRWT